MTTSFLYCKLVVKMRQPGHGNEDARVLTIDLEELTWALNSRDPLGESSHGLNVVSGAILSLIGPDAEDDVDAHDISPRWADRPNRPTP